MSLDRIFLILVCLAAGLGALGLAGVALFTSSHISLGITAIIVIILGFVVYITWRLLAERIGNADEDHYDGMEN